jgi:hypothetical protein
VAHEDLQNGFQKKQVADHGYGSRPKYLGEQQNSWDLWMFKKNMV